MFNFGRIPIIGGKDLDLHKLFKEVTHRGGIQKVKEIFFFNPIPDNSLFVFPEVGVWF
jgi:ARID/BRIGHT DNA binding domain